MKCPIYKLLFKIVETFHTHGFRILANFGSTNKLTKF